MRGALAIGCGTAVGIAAVGAAAAGAGSAAPEVACGFDRDNGALLVSPGITGGGPGQTPFVSIGREGKEIAIRELAGGRATRRRCAGGRPTVRNTDRIHVGTPVRVADVLVVIDLSGGPLAPGATREPGGSEIEIEFYNGPKARFRLVGSEAADAWALGSRHKDFLQVNLNAGEGMPDRDLRINPQPRQLAAAPGGGADELRSGGAGTGGPMVNDLELSGGAGADLLVGGKGDDLLAGGDGDDVLRGEDGDDRLDLSRGDGEDLLDCGPGRDRFGRDPADRVKHC